MKSKFNEKKLSIFKGLDEKLETYAKSNDQLENHIRSLMCLHSFDLLFRIFITSYDNSKTIKQLFEILSTNLAYLKKTKELGFYKAKFVPAMVPFLKFIYLFKPKK